MPFVPASDIEFLSWVVQDLWARYKVVAMMQEAHREVIEQMQSQLHAQAELLRARDMQISDLQAQLAQASQALQDLPCQLSVVSSNPAQELSSHATSMHVPAAFAASTISNTMHACMQNMDMMSL